MHLYKRISINTLAFPFSLAGAASAYRSLSGKQLYHLGILYLATTIVKVQN